jgi:D-serine deaminase-like pyridoxal phosphate-dependent protein
MLEQLERVGTAITKIDTPALTIELDILARNIARLQSYLSGHGIVSRPHAKTHKIPAIAHAQMQAGAVGLTCQKLGEAEVMADSGVTDVMVPMNIVGATKLARLSALARRIRLSVTADDSVIVRGLSAAAVASEFTLQVLVECDTGQGRCGVQSPSAAVELAQMIAHVPGLAFRGLATYPTSAAAADFVTQASRLLSQAGLPPEVISGGGTPGVWRLHELGGFTEHRAGEYIFNDRHTVGIGDATLDDCSLRVRATVVSRPTADRAVLDSGSKTLTTHPGRGLTGFGLILEYPDAAVVRLTEEHGIVDLSRCTRKPEIGEGLTIIPNHSSVVMNMADVAYGVRKERVEAVWPVLARGRTR